MTLENKYTWEEIGELTADRIEKNLRPKGFNKEDFLSWFAAREGAGWRFDFQLVYKAWQICRKISAGQDYFCLIVGKEGSGKSTLAVQLAAWVSPDKFCLDHVCYNADQYVRLMHERASKMLAGEQVSGLPILMDEAGVDLFSRDFMSSSSKNLTKTFFVQRVVGSLVILCLPNYFMIDNSVRKHRINLLLICSSRNRGNYKALNTKAVQTVNINADKYGKNIYVIPLPDGSFFTGKFNKTFPGTINYEAYFQHKLKNVQAFLGAQLEETPSQDWVKVSVLASKVGCDSRKFIRMIEAETLPGKKIGGNWYIPATEYDKLTHG